MTKPADKRTQLEELLRQAERSRVNAAGRIATSAPASVSPTTLTPGATSGAAGEPIAIVGLAGRYPGAETIDEFWSNLVGRWNCIEEIQGDRLEDHLTGIDPALREAALRIRHFGLLRDIYRFDAPFFALSRREAEVMDPHMRLLIEAAWACVENAGYRPRALGGRTGVFVSFYNHEYAEMLRDLEIEPASEAYLGTATTGAIFANRISYLLGLTGPSEVYDTACSTALVALHRSIQAIRAGECDQAIVAGASLLLTPSRVLALGKMGILNESGLCNPYSHPANKEAIGEGVGALLIKPLERAVADGDYVYCVVRGSDVGHQGARSAGMTLPSAEALAELMTATYRRLGPDAVDALRYIEGHGAGGETDVIELWAIQTFLAGAGVRDRKIPVGSVKSNIGFGEASGGIAQLTKCALALQAGEMPATLHFQRTDPVFDYEDALLRIADHNMPIADDATNSAVGILAYGLGGTNAHVVLGTHRNAPAGIEPVATSRVFPLLFSAGSETELATYVRQVGAHLTGGATARRYRELFRSEADLLHAMARTLAAREREQRCRVVFLATNVTDVLACCEAFNAKRSDERILRAADAAPKMTADTVVERAFRWVKGDAGTAAAGCFDAGRYQKLPLPPVPFRGEVHRLKPRSISRVSTARAIEDRWSITHEGAGIVAEIVLEPNDCLIAQHRVDDLPVLPGVAYIALLTALTRKLQGHDRCTIENLAWTLPLTLEQGRATLRCEVNVAGRFRISHRELGRLCCTGRLMPEHAPAESIRARVRAADLADVTLCVDAARYWSLANAPETRQFHGPDLRRLSYIHQIAGAMVGVLEPRKNSTGELPEIAFYDSALGVCRGFSILEATGSQSVVPFAVEQVRVLQPISGDRRIYAAVERRSGALTRYDISIEDGAGTVFAVFTGYYPKAFTTLARAAELATSAPSARKTNVPVSAASALSAPAASLRDSLLHELRGQFAAFLKCDVAAIPLDGRMEHLGLDSIGINALTDQLRSSLDVDLPATTLFEYASLNDVVGYLVAEFGNALSLSRNGALAAAKPVGQAEPSANAPAAKLAPVGTSMAAVTTSDSSAADIAVVGIGGYFPGAEGVHEFWRRICEGHDLITEMPEARRRSVYQVYREALRELKGVYGGFVADADRFDAGFFGLAEAEVMAMDPQQRLFLEAAWASIEDAGYHPPSLSGQRVGVYVGAIVNDYGAYLAEVGYPVSMFHEGTGSSLAGIANRVSYVLNLTGPSLALDAACCSSLYALDRAVGDLRSGVCDAALAGGVSFIGTASGYQMYSAMKYLAKDWRCKAFAAGGDGWSKAELFASVFLKRHEDAVRDGDPIYGVIKATGTNHGGRGYFYTQPNSARHVELVRDVYRKAKVDPASIVHIEAHGSGTEMGDVLEFNSLSRALKEYAAEEGVVLPPSRCGIGSIKSNLGHAEAGSGILGFIKTVLLLHAKRIPPTLHLETVNPNLREEGSPLHLVRAAQELAPRAEGDAPRCASVHSFNFSGATAHALVAEHIARPETQTLGLTRYPICLSAKTPQALATYRRTLARFLRDASNADLSLDRLAFTLARSRSQFDHRWGTIVTSRAELLARLEAEVQPESSDSADRSADCYAGVARRTSAGRETGFAPLCDEHVERSMQRWVTELAFDWTTALHGLSLQKLNLPTYPFDHSVSYFPQVAAKDLSRSENGNGAAPKKHARFSLPLNASAPATRAVVSSALVSSPVAVVAAAANGTAVEAQLVQILARVLSMAPAEIDLERSVSDFGFDSSRIVALATALNARFGLEIKPPDLFEFSRPAEIAAFISRAQSTLGESAPIAIKLAAGPSSDGVAIIGMAGQFPGAADLDEFWSNLVAGKDAITEIPADRWDWRRYQGDAHRETNKTDVRWGGFIADVTTFDPLFFGISPREAEWMDPQQRLLMMYAWRAIEDAGYAPSQLAGTDTGIFVGTGSSQYSTRATATGEAFGATGSIPSLGPNRLSHFLDLHGPSETVETSCSSALVAVHRAVAAIQASECRMAIAGGVNTIVTPDEHISFSKAGMLAKDGRCKTFSAGADGYGRGEGVGLVVLKSLAAAERDGDHIYAVIRGSAVNHGGRASSLTAPNPRAQAELLKAAHTKAGVDPRTVGYIEAHGTGTALGDPIEINGLKAAFRMLYQETGDAGPIASHCALGSVKTNIGHLELAAGVAGLIKVLLQLRHRMLVKSLHCAQVNPYLDLAGSPFHLLAENREWIAPRDMSGRTLPRRAGVSSFGFGGVNAHVVLEEYCPTSNPAELTSPCAPQLVVLSARDTVRLRDVATNLERFLGANPEVCLADVAFTLQVGRDAMAERLAFTAESVAEVRTKLQRFIATGDVGSGASRGRAAVRRDNRDDGASTANGADVESGDLAELGERWVRGAPVDWTSLWSSPARRIPLPTYPFARDRCWLDTGTGAAPAVEENDHGETTFIPRWEPATSDDRGGEGNMLRVPRRWVVIHTGNPSGMVNALVERCTHLWPDADGRRIEIGTLTERDGAKAGAWTFDGNDAEGLAACLEAVAPVDTMFFVSGSAALDLDQPHREELQLLRLAKTLKRQMAASDAVECYILTRDNFRIGDDAVNASGGGLTGLAYAIAQADHRFRVRNIDLDSEEMARAAETPALIDLILQEPPSDRGESIKFHAGVRYRRRLFSCAENSHATGSGFRVGGRYVILGGGGRVGEAVTCLLVEKYRAEVVWIGRRPADDPALQEKLRTLPTGSSLVRYVQADVLDLDSLRSALAQIKLDHGPIHGAIFAGAVFSFENGFAGTTEREFVEIIEVKTRGSMNFMAALRHEPLDFLCYFSSAQSFSFSGAANLSAYAAGITFTDTWVNACRATSPFPVGSINWGFWQTEDGNPAAKGDVGELDRPTAFRCLVHFVGLLRKGVLHQIVCLRASDAVRRMMPIAEETAMIAPHAAAALDLARVVERGRMRSAPAASSLADEFEGWILRLMSAQLSRCGEARSDGAPGSVFENWRAETRRLLAQNDAKIDAAADAGAVWAAWEEWRASCAAGASLGAQIQLAHECLRAVPDIFAGRVRPTDILFPGASMERVERVYRDNGEFDFFNRVVADAVQAAIEQAIAADPAVRVRILEIGAGTGGTTAMILPRLDTVARNIAGYCYSDVSRAFLDHGERTFAAGRPYLTFRLLDIEQPTALEFAELGTYDVVIAANVLHATKDIRRTICHAKAALKQRGLLVLNEISGPSLFAHATFGLLDGWWRFEDAALRIPGSPGLYPGSWDAILREEGFTTVAFPAQHAHPLGQQVVVATSDGVIRRRVTAPRGESPAAKSAAIFDPRPAAVASGDSDATLERVVLRVLSSLLKIPEGQFQRDVPFSDYGVDSILGVSFVTRLGDELGLAINSAILFDYATIDRLVGYLGTRNAERRPVDGKLVVQVAAVARSDAEVRTQAGAESQPHSSFVEIAVIGMAGQFPGAADVDTFWRNLITGMNCTQELPPLYRNGTNAVANGASESGYRWGGILEERACFDPLFFNISPREAESMTPHQRLVLQESWNALEDAGINPRSLGGKSVGLFVGAEPSGYEHETFTGASDAIIASRLSYFLNLKGPALVVNTGCSSSAAAIHLACESLATGGAALALAGGVFATMDQAMLTPLARMGMLSPTGCCRPFDAAADGTVFSEGVGIVVLKRLRDAIADGDLIHGVIQASGMNQDGASNGLTAPNGEAQEELIASLYRRFAIDPERIGYVEAHGTGTSLGDPVEANALTRAFRQFTRKENFCALGSVKSAIGHASAASGVISLIKVLLMLRHGKIPPLANFSTLNPLIELPTSPFYINNAMADWRADERGVRWTALNSFGHSGTNVHLVVRSFEAVARPVEAAGPQVVVVSAREESRLREAVTRLASYLDETPTCDLASVAYTLQIGREAMKERLAFVARDVGDLRAQLRAWLAVGESTPTCWRARVEPAAGVSRLLQSDEDVRELTARWRERGLWGKIAELWCLGGAVDWPRLHLGNKPPRVRLPAYPFAKEQYWTPQKISCGSAALESNAVASSSGPGGEVLAFEEVWAPITETAAVVSPKANHVLCLLSDPQRQEEVRAEFAARDSQVRITFLCERDMASEGAAAFQRIKAKAGQIDAVLYLWPLENRALISDATAPISLLQTLRVAGLKPRQVVLAGGFAKGVERCHLESWIGLERSMAFAWPGVRVAVLLGQQTRTSLESPSVAQWTARCWHMLNDAQATSTLYENDVPHRLNRRAVTLAAGPALSLGGKTVLITGGLGGLGALVAARLAARGSINLIVTGRSPRNEKIETALRVLESGGRRVHYIQADVSDLAAMTAGLAEARGRFGPIHAVIHAAGVKDERTMFEKRPAEIRAVLAAKVSGALVLDEVLAADPLEFVAYFSSVAAALGDFGAGDYAIGNRFLLAHATQRNALVAAGQRCGRAVAMGWSVWQGAGMARTDEPGAEFLQSSGQRALRIEEGLDCFERLLAQPNSQVFIVAGDAERVSKAFGYAHVSPPRDAAAGADHGGGEARLRGELREKLARLLKLNPERLGERQNFADFGLDSVNLIEFARVLSDDYGVELTPAAFFGHSTIHALAKFLLAQPGVELRRDVASARSAPRSALASSPAAISQALSSSSVPEPIAIIGMSGRFAAARNVEELWQILRDGRSAIREVPAEQFGVFPGVESDAAPTGLWCGCLPGAAEFDAAFFEISPLEAESMDPRQRLLLQEGWNALEDAGYGRAHLEAQRIGMFVGAEEGDYQQRVSEGSITSNHTGVLASRLAYFLNLKGPVLAINTSCSSSLVAVHQACGSLRNGECDAAIVAGVNLITARETFLAMMEAGMLSADGKCHAFDRRANGMVPGEAVAVIVLKRLSRALAEGDAIHAVIAGSGINYDGKTNGITAPNGVAQTALLKSIYPQAGVDPAEVDLIVTHGTGTRLGDPVEVNALREAFEMSAPRPEPCVLVSCKPNLGHTFAASGLVSVIALVQALRHAMLPGSVHFDERNEFIRWDDGPFTVNRERAEWPAGAGRVRTGAVSAFGMSGTNAHLILREAPARPPVAKAAQPAPCTLLVWSAVREDALRKRSRQLAEHLRQGGLVDADLEALSSTLLLGRHHFRHRCAVVVRTVAEAIAALELAADHTAAQSFYGVVPSRFEANPASRVELAAWFDELTTLRAQADPARYSNVMEQLASRYREGHDADWARLFGGRRLSPLRLPTYPFLRREFWLPARSAETKTAESTNGGELADFGARLRLPNLAAECASSGADSPDVAMESRAREVLAATLAELGLFAPRGNQRQLVEIATGRPAATYLQRWLDESRRLLGESGVVPDVPARSVATLWQEWERARADWAGNPALTARAALLETCLRALPDILQGRRQATEVMFPDSSVELVEGVYRHDRVAALFNDAVASAVVAWVESRLARDASATLRLLEIGAGTGGTTAVILPRLERFRGHIVEYAYTDLSRAFMLHAEERFVPGHSFVVPKLFDLAKPAAAQGIASSHYDLVIGANVLHATPDIRRAVRNVKGALRPGGGLMLNEVSANGWFTHLTFGLLEGWWLYTDPELRLPGCPGLSSATWKRILSEVGFGPVLFPAEAAHGLGQQLIVAVSDGRTAASPEMEAKPAMARVASATGTRPIAITNVPQVRDGDVRDRKRCTEYFRELIARTLKMEPREIDPDEALEAYGVDSLTIGKVLARLREVFREVPGTLLFETRTVSEVANHFWASRRAEVLAQLGERPIESIARDVAPEVQPAVATDAGAINSSPGTLAREPIAIIGLAGRYPSAPDLRTFWENLCAGKDCITEVPPDRWSLEGFFESDPERAIEAGKSYCKWGGFLERFSEFDPLFFKIAPREAMHMDPQERLFVQAAWEVLEDAGYTPKSLVERTGGRVGVFTGITHSDYNIFGPDQWRREQRIYPRTSFSSVPNRVSFLFNLQGPSLPIDTMCSSSLTALHEACESILRGECAMAIAGAVNLCLHPSSYVALCGARMLSKRGECHSFGVGEDGYIPGEGVGAVLLKRLSEAVRDGDRIHAVIRGTAVNHGGRTNGYTVPDPQSQGRVVREALDRAGINARTISYIEAHGTGTKLGDPIEVAGLVRSFRSDTADNSFCAIGSVKSNVGHLEAAAGIVGLTKVILAMKHGQLPPSLHAEELNPEIDFSNSPFVVQRVLSPWIRPTVTVKGVTQTYPRRAGVSSFGAGGANAHIVVEEYVDPRPANVSDAESCVVVLSARDPERLVEATRRLLAFVQQTPGLSLADVAYTLQVGREPMDERLGVVVSTLAELECALRGYLENGEAKGLRRGQARGSRDDDEELLEKEELAELVAKLIERRKYDRLLGVWVRGGAVDWQGLYRSAQPRCVSLPTYPFAPERYWFSDTPEIEPRANEKKGGAQEDPRPESASGLSWAFLREAWEEWPFPEQLDWKTRLQQQAGRRIAIVAAERSEAERLRALLRQLESTAEMTAPLQVDLLGPDDSFRVGELPQVVFCLGPQAETSEAAELNERGIELVFNVSQRLMNAGWGDPIALYYIYGSSEAKPRIDCDAISGFVRAAMKENEQHGWTLIGHDERHSPESRLQVLLKEWLFAARPDAGTFAGVDVRHLGETRQVRMLVDAPPPATAASVFRERGVYLLAGGLGYLGQQLSLALAKRCRATLVLFSRGPLDETRREHCRRLEALGATVFSETVDAGDRADLERAYRNIKRMVGPVHGVFHLARQHDDRMIARKTWASFRDVLRTKVHGTCHLDELTKDEPLDFFAVFSSLGAYGVRGASDYSFATAFQNAFSRHRAQRFREGLRRGVSLALCWGPWLEDRMFPKSRTTLVEAGFGLIGMDAGFPLIERALAGNTTPLTIVAMNDRAKVRHILGLNGTTPVAAGMGDQATEVGPFEDALRNWEALRSRGTDISGRLAARFTETDIERMPDAHVNRVYRLLFGENGNSESLGERGVSRARPVSNGSRITANAADVADVEQIAALLRIVFKEVLQLTAIQDARTFQDYGMDSISGMQAAVRLEKLLKREVPPQWLINFPTIAALSKHLLAEKFIVPPGESR